MAFRKVIVTERCKLEYSLNCLICRKADDQKKIFLDEIKLLIINSPQVSITSALLIECMKRKIKILFTDEKHNPAGELMPYQNNYYTFRKIKEQLNFKDLAKTYLWKKIIEEKIKNQARNLEYIHALKEFEMLSTYSHEVEYADTSNREGHAAKVYFNALFGNGFNRKENNNINKYLNYGYSLLLSSINREIKSLGYLTELGIHHIGESNPFNLSCDFMEPLRPIIDSFIIRGLINEENFKKELVEILSLQVMYRGREFYLDNAIELYVEDLFSFLRTGDESKIHFIEYEL